MLGVSGEIGGRGATDTPTLRGNLNNLEHWSNPGIWESGNLAI